MYRIVGLEVDPRSVSSDSLKMKDSENGKKEAGEKCMFPQDPKIFNLEKDSMFILCVSALLYVAQRSPIARTHIICTCILP